MARSTDRFAGCLLDLALGDAAGAPREGGVAERLAWCLLGRTSSGRMRWTDDTQMTLALTESLIANQGWVVDDAALRMARAHQWRRGYGPGAAQVLARIRRGEPWQSANRRVYPNGSYGNGGAMRVAPLALWFAPDAAAVWQAARDSAAITHAHDEAQWGAGAMAWRCAPPCCTGSQTARRKRRQIFGKHGSYPSMLKSIKREARHTRMSCAGPPTNCALLRARQVALAWRARRAWAQRVVPAPMARAIVRLLGSRQQARPPQPPRPPRAS
jgi:ADP-ribosylglycohydrolase